MIRTFFIFLFVISLASCEQYDLGAGYTINYDSKLDKNIILKNSGGKAIQIYRHDSLIQSRFLQDDAILINSYIHQVTKDSTFILIDQKPLDSLCECVYGCFIKMPTFDERSYARCKEALDKSTLHVFWIIDKSNDRIFGPLAKEEYDRKRKQIRVPDKLKLHF